MNAGIHTYPDDCTSRPDKDSQSLGNIYSLKTLQFKECPSLYQPQLSQNQKPLTSQSEIKVDCSFLLLRIGYLDSPVKTKTNLDQKAHYL